MRVLNPSTLRYHQWGEPDDTMGAYQLAKAIGDSPWFYQSGMDPQALKDAAFFGAGTPAVMAAGQQGMQQVGLENQLDEMQRRAQLDYLARMAQIRSNERIQNRKLGFQAGEGAANRAQQTWATQGGWDLGREKIASGERIAGAGNEQAWSKFLLGEAGKDRRTEMELRSRAQLAEQTKESPLARGMELTKQLPGPALAGEGLRDPNHPLVKYYWPIAQELADDEQEAFVNFSRILQHIQGKQDPAPIIAKMRAERQAKLNSKKGWW